MKRQELLLGGAFETETARLRDLAPRIERTGEGVDSWVVEHGNQLSLMQPPEAARRLQEAAAEGSADSWLAPSRRSAGSRPAMRARPATDRLPTPETGSLGTAPTAT